MMLTKRDFLGEEVWLRWKRDEESLQQYRNEVSKRGKPTEEERLIMQINKPWLEFYRRVLYDPDKAKNKA
jgi:hypothetical protein